MSENCKACGRPKCEQVKTGEGCHFDYAFGTDVCHGGDCAVTSKSMAKRIAAQKGAEPCPVCGSSICCERGAFGPCAHLLAGGAAPAPPPASEADDLTGLIERIENATHRSNLDEMLLLPALIDAERDTIVLALRVLRVLHETATASSATGVRLSETTEEIRVDVEHEDHFSWGVTLDEAERLLGIGGEK